MADSGNIKSKAVGIWLVILLLSVIASLAVLFSRIQSYSVNTFENIIPLIAPESAETAETAETGTSAQASGTEAAAGTGGHPSFIAHDGKTVWQTNTEVDIFKLTYDETGSITVKSNAGRSDKLIAPGTSNQYSFTFENNGDVPLDYTMTMEAWVEGTENRLPMRARVWDYQNRYLLGNAGVTEDIMALNTVREDAVLGAGRYAYYTLEWEWPFEQGADQYDTMLGDLAVDGDLTLTIRITTTAQYDENPDDPAVSDAGVPGLHTGDDTPIKAIVTVLAAAMLLACAALFAHPKQKDEDDEQTER